MNKRKSIKKIYYKNKMNYFMAIFFTIADVLLDISLAFILKMLLDISSGGNMEELKKMIIINIIFMIAFVGFKLLVSVFSNRYIALAMKSYKGYIFERVINKKISTFNNDVTSKYISNLTNDAGVIENNYVKNSIEIIKAVLTLCGGIIAMFYLNWIFAVTMVVASFLPLTVSMLFGSKLGAIDKTVSNKNEDFVALTKDLFSGFSVIKSFKAEKEVTCIFEETNSELEDIKNKRRFTFDVVGAISAASYLIVSIVSFSVGAYLAITGSITVGTVAAFVQMLNYVVGPVSEMGPLISNKRAALGLIAKIEDNIEEMDERDKKQIISEFKNKISIEDVSFGYDEKNDTLKNITLTFEKGKSYAIVGASGTGKSTLLNLLLGYYDNYKGKILIDNHELRQIKSESLYNIISTIQQNVFVFNACINDNITMYKSFESERINSAIDKSGLKEVIENKGIDYKCGENGCYLSGGEKQRISIARSLLKNNQILLLDEATSALDNKTAMEIEKVIVELDDITRIVVTHKLDENLLRQYDEIIVLKNGKVFEKGSFDQLCREKGQLFSIINLSSEI